jgi:hypothetical protein
MAIDHISVWRACAAAGSCPHRLSRAVDWEYAARGVMCNNTLHPDYLGRAWSQQGGAVPRAERNGRARQFVLRHCLPGRCSAAHLACALRTWLGPAHPGRGDARRLSRCASRACAQFRPRRQCDGTLHAGVGSPNRSTQLRADSWVGTWVETMGNVEIRKQEGGIRFPPSPPVPALRTLGHLGSD